jgi:predicted SnoaL-like aldol condensation-catalyzing enzyme
MLRRFFEATMVFGLHLGVTCVHGSSLLGHIKVVFLLDSQKNFSPSQSTTIICPVSPQAHKAAYIPLVLAESSTTYSLLPFKHKHSAAMSNAAVLADVERIWKEQLTDQPKQTPEQIKAAKALIELFEATFNYHDYDVTRRLVAKDYIQHNVTVGTGQDSILEFAARECADPATRPLFGYKRILVDGQYVVVHLLVKMRNGMGDLKVIEIFRYEDGVFTEHWDSMAPIPPLSEHKNSNGVF